MIPLSTPISTPIINFELLGLLFYRKKLLQNLLSNKVRLIMFIYNHCHFANYTNKKVFLFKKNIINLKLYR